jgi:hypothetical protein
MRLLQDLQVNPVNIDFAAKISLAVSSTEFSSLLHDETVLERAWVVTVVME